MHLSADERRVERVTVRNAVFGILAEQAHRVVVRGNLILGPDEGPLATRGDRSRLGEVRDSLTDLTVLTLQTGLFSLGRFAYKLWVFGHDLDPRAPIDVEPFMPVLIGEKTIANFKTESWPAAGSASVALFALGTAALLAWHLIAGRRAAIRARRTAAAGS